MTLTKVQIIESIQDQTGFPKNKSSNIVESLLEIIKSTLASGEDVLVSGFGKFCVREKNERKGRNPASGEDMMLAQRRVVTFKCSGKLREMINGRLENIMSPGKLKKILEEHQLWLDSDEKDGKWASWCRP